MKYSQSTEAAIDSLFFMAAHPERHDFSVEEIAQAQHLSPSYLAKTFQQLVKAGLLRSHRGSKGGYFLARNASEISLLDIAQVFEGATPLYECNASSKYCTLGPRCLILSTFQKADRAMQEVLKGVSLANVLMNFREHSSEAAWIGAEAVQTITDTAGGTLEPQARLQD